LNSFFMAEPPLVSISQARPVEHKKPNDDRNDFLDKIEKVCYN
jgi:hypothetical protein